jgi:hypothetical protein
MCPDDHGGREEEGKGMAGREEGRNSRKGEAARRGREDDKQKEGRQEGRQEGIPMKDSRGREGGREANCCARRILEG